MMKVCTKCGVEKPLDMFNRHPVGATGRHPRCKECRSKENALRYQRVGAAPYSAEKNRKHKYGVTPEHYDSMMKEQDGKCAICRKERKLAVDHCHETGRIRGLLCQLCNQGLGKLGDNVEGVKAALDYLNK